MLLSLVLLLLPSTPSPGLLGEWVTPDKSIVQLYACGTALCARIAYVDPAVGHSTDGLNPDTTKRSRPLCGLIVGTGFSRKDEAHAEGGRLYDPESGNTYSGTLTLADSATLKLRGYVGFSVFGRSETWHRAQSSPPACR